QVAAQLSIRFAPSSQGTRPVTQNPAAYDLYLKARLASQQLALGGRPEDYRTVIGLLNESLTHDPNFGLPYIDRALIRIAQFSAGMGESWEKTAQALRADLAAAERLMGETPMAIAVSGWSMYLEDGLRAERALREFERADAAGLNDP